MTTIGEKAAYVKSQRQTRKHACHWPNCGKQVPPAMWGCKPHWYALPLSIRRKIWGAYRPGQERDLAPSKAYITAANQAQDWIRENYGVGDNPHRDGPRERAPTLDFYDGAGE